MSLFSVLHVLFVILCILSLSSARFQIGSRFWVSTGSLPIVGTSRTTNLAFDHDGVHYGGQLRASGCGAEGALTLSTGNRFANYMRTGDLPGKTVDETNNKNGAFFSRFNLGNFADEKDCTQQKSIRCSTGKNVTPEKGHAENNFGECSNNTSIKNRVSNIFDRFSNSVAGSALDRFSASYSKGGFKGGVELRGRLDYNVGNNKSLLHLSGSNERIALDCQIENMNLLRRVGLTLAGDVLGRSIIVKPSYDLVKKRGTLYTEAALSNTRLGMSGGLQMGLEYDAVTGTGDVMLSGRGIFKGGRDMIAPSYRHSTRLASFEYARKLDFNKLLYIVVNSDKDFALQVQETSHAGALWSATVRGPIDNPLDSSIKVTREIAF